MTKIDIDTSFTQFKPWLRL